MVASWQWKVLGYLAGAQSSFYEGFSRGPLSCLMTGLCRSHSTPRTENQMDKKMEHEMEAGTVYLLRGIRLSEN